MALSPALLLALASQCSPSVAPETLVSVVRVESGFDPLVIGVNSPAAEHIHPKSLPDAVATSTRLLAAGANIDLGLGQINSANLERLGLSIADAFDPCRNLRASGRMIEAGYLRAHPQPGAEQAALQTSLSLYNTGDPWRGFANGYVAKVVAAAVRIVPALQPNQPTPAVSAPPSAPVWDVFARPAGQSAAFVFIPATLGDAP
jgi:type IV secretion system protein VirB1